MKYYTAEVLPTRRSGVIPMQLICSTRKSFDSTCVRAFSKSENPNELFILGNYESRETDQQLFQSPEFRDATKRAGITSLPEGIFLDAVIELAA